MFSGLIDAWGNLMSNSMNNLLRKLTLIMYMTRINCRSEPARDSYLKNTTFAPANHRH